MRRFLISFFLFITPILSVAFLLLFQIDGKSDAYYLRFTSKKQESLIIGTSRSAQGIKPTLINNKTGSNFYNYSFTIAHSPYGKVYLKSIKSKLKNPLPKGQFILSVDPWSISSKFENGKEIFQEERLCVGQVSNVYLNPNLEYLIKSSHRPLKEMIFNKSENEFLHNDGWLEISVDVDSSTVNKRINKKLELYWGYQEIYKPSPTRLKYLKHTIEFLSAYGQVYLVRLPIHPEMMVIENKYYSSFNEVIVELSKDYSVPFWDFTELNKSFVYTDGNHLYKKSANDFSKILSDSLNLYNQP